MAAGRWILSAPAKRMARLARSENELARSLEARFIAEDQKARSLQASVDELVRITNAAPLSHLPFHGTALKRLADAETGLKECRARAESIRGDFISARARAKALIAKAAFLSLASERKILEEEALETTIAMAAKASGKTGMMK